MINRRAFLFGGVAALAVSRVAMAQDDSYQLSLYDLEVTWKPRDFHVEEAGTGVNEDGTLEHLYLRSEGSQTNSMGDLTFDFGSFPFESVEDITDYFDSDDVFAQYMWTTEIERLHEDDDKKGACLLFLPIPPTGGKWGSFNYTEFRKIGTEHNEWSSITFDGNLEQFDADLVTERLEAVEVDGDPVFKLLEVDELVELLDDARKEFL